MRRRHVLALLGGATSLLPLRTAAQQKIYRLAIAHPSRPVSDLTETGPEFFRVLFGQLARLGYIEGANLRVERYSAAGRSDQFIQIAKIVARSNPDVVFVVSVRFAAQFKNATRTVPIVALTTDPLRLGLAQSLARPERNVTGVVTDNGVQVWDKQLEFLTAIVPTASKLAYLAPRAVWDNELATSIRAAAKRAGVELFPAVLNDPIHELEYERVFAVMQQQGIDGLVVSDASENYANDKLIIKMCEQARLPAVYPNELFARDGGLISYGNETAELARHAVQQITKIFNGKKPADIPFYQPTKLKLIINLKTAKSLGVTIPQWLFARADEVIE
jgi:putative ABC transport system substrate-binding protein